MVQITDLSYTYPQNGRGIGPFSFSVKPGEILHVTGTSGCGKSTLARCVTGLIPHIYNGTMRGRVRIDGRVTEDTPLWKLSRLAGFVFQNPSMQMLGNSVEEELIIGMENLGLGRGEMKKRMKESLDRFGLGAFRDRRPQTLSGGEQQKLALAAILARRPPVLVLDEPLSMLDVVAASELTEHLSELARAGTTIIAFEHRSDYLAGMPGIRVMPLDRVTAPAQIADPPQRANAPLRASAGAHLEVSGLGVTIVNRRIFTDLNLSDRKSVV